MGNATDDPTREELAHAIGEVTGLRLLPGMEEPLLAHVHDRARRHGMSPKAYLEDQLGDAAERAAMVQALTIGETHFFRGRARLEAIRTHVLPDIVDRAIEQSRDIRIVSAGCATGEEIYTISIFLRELLESRGCPDLRVDLIGADINPDFLDRARAARYSEWSLRGVTAEVRARYFDRDEGGYVLATRLRRGVRFVPLDLAEEADRSAGPGFAASDLVLCQNVLYYLLHEHRDHALARLVGWLRPRGWLLVGATDNRSGFIEGCEPVTIDDTVLYRQVAVGRTERRSDPELASVIPPAYDVHEWVSLPSAPPLPRHSTASPPSERPVAQPEEKDVARGGVEELLELAREAGPAAALERLEQQLIETPEVPSLHALHGLLHAETGDHGGALECFRRALYLDPSSPLAHAGAAIAAQHLGRPSVVRRHAARARALCRQERWAERPVEAWEGMTTRELVSIMDAVCGEDPVGPR